MIVSRTSPLLYLVSRLIIAAMAVAIILPIMWMFATSLRLPRESWALPPDFIPRPPFLWSNYARVFLTFPFFTHLQNSVIVSSVAVTGQLIASTMAAFALGRIKFKGANVIFVLILAGLMVPVQIRIIPLFIIMRELQLINTLLALILPHLAFPIAVFLLRQFIMTIPKDYDEAAALEGMGRLGVFSKIIVPMLKPAILVSAIMHLLIVWNDFFQPLVLIRSLDTMTLPLGLFQLEGAMGAGSMSVILAGVIMSIIPPLLFFAVGQKYLMLGLESGGLKF